MAARPSPSVQYANCCVVLVLVRDQDPGRIAVDRRWGRLAGLLAGAPLQRLLPALNIQNS
jgi:hypothetical protein